MPPKFGNRKAERLAQRLLSATSLSSSATAGTAFVRELAGAVGGQHYGTIMKHVSPAMAQALKAKLVNSAEPSSSTTTPTTSLSAAGAAGSSPVQTTDGSGGGGGLIRLASELKTGIDRDEHASNKQKLTQLLEANRALKQQAEAQLAANENQAAALARQQADCQKQAEQWHQKEAAHAVELAQVRELNQRKADLLLWEQRLSSKQTELDARTANAGQQYEGVQRLANETESRQKAVEALRAECDADRHRLHQESERVTKESSALALEKTRWFETQRKRESEHKAARTRVLELQRQWEDKNFRSDRLLSALEQKRSVLAKERVQWQADRVQRADEEARQRQTIAALLTQRAQLEADLIELVRQLTTPTPQPTVSHGVPPMKTPIVAVAVPDTPTAVLLLSSA